MWPFLICYIESFPYNFFKVRKRKNLDVDEIVSADENTSEDESDFVKEPSGEEFEDVQETAFRKAKQLLKRLQASFTVVRIFFRESVSD